MNLPVEDVLAINQLAAAYCHLMDAGDGAGLADLFTPDGVFEIVDLMTSNGADELAQNTALFPQFVPGGRHVVSNVWASPDPAGDANRATVQCYLTTLIAGDTPQLLQTGRYVDEVVRTDAGWRYARRTLTLDGPLFPS